MLPDAAMVWIEWRVTVELVMEGDGDHECNDSDERSILKRFIRLQNTIHRTIILHRHLKRTPPS
jgi:hypothetical protein